jgi:hypothetical protein
MSKGHLFSISFAAASPGCAEAPLLPPFGTIISKLVHQIEISHPCLTTGLDSDKFTRTKHTATKTWQKKSMNLPRANTPKKTAKASMANSWKHSACKSRRKQAIKQAGTFASSSPGMQDMCLLGLSLAPTGSKRGDEEGEG